MGRSTTPRYIVQLVEVAPPGLTAGTHTPYTWHVKSRTNVTGYGAPTDDNLTKYVMEYAKSLKLGGVNAHLSKADGYVPYPNIAYIKDQKTGRVVARWKAAMFQIFP